MSKSSYHRSENTFKFQTFGDRLAQVNVDVARRIQKTSSTPEDADTFFGAALDKWSELNCTRHFQDFRKEISGEVHSLAQLLHHQNAIVDTLHRHLRVKNSLAYQPLLDLTAQLARDLQADFYPHFECTFGVIISVLQHSHHDVDTLEQAFTGLAYIFKFLWRTMLADIRNVYAIFSPLLGGNYREYINSFAAESFAFLLRKVKNHDELFDFIFSQFTESPDQTSGVGRLLFGCVKGVQNQFHTVADRVIPVLLRKLSNPKLPLDEVSECMIELWTCMASHASPQSTHTIWTALMEEVRDLQQKGFKGKSKGHAARVKGLLHVLSLIQSWIDFKNGALVTVVDELTQLMVELLELSTLPDDVADPLLTAVAHLLLASKCNVSPSRRAALIKAMFASKIDSSHIFTFCRSVFSVPLFEKDVLGGLLSYCDQLVGDDSQNFPEVIHLLTDLILHKVPTCDLTSKTYDLQVKSAKTKSDLVVAMEIHLAKEVVETTSEAELSVLWATLTCLPHARPLDTESWCQHLHQLLPQLASAAQSSPQLQVMLLCSWEAAVRCLVKIQESDELFTRLPLDTVLNMIRFAGSDVHVLGGVAVYLRHVKESGRHAALTSDIFSDIFPHLQSNLSQPYSLIRQLTLEICTLFEFEYPPQPDDGHVAVGVFAICLAAEQIEADMQTYRDKLVQLRKLDWSNIQSQLPTGPYTQVALHYLLGALYVNMKLMWEPVMELIASHAHNMKRDDFWAVFGPQLERAAAHTEELLLQARKDVSTVEMESSEDSEDKSGLSELFEQQWNHLKYNTDRIHHPIYRDHLWQATHKFPDQCETRSKIIVPLFFTFLEREYYPADLMVAPTQNLLKDVDEDEEEDDGDADVEDGEKPSKKEKKQKAGKKRKRGQRATNKTFIHHLRLFSKIRNPRSLTRESELHKLYHELLCHRDVEVQKVAFECIMQYKYKYLTPYRENFENLLDDKNFKTEIISFSLDSEQTIIQSDHRAQLLPILMRILYGKMQTKTGKDTSGRAYSRLRKTLVLRFLAGCQPEELNIFLDLVFEPFKHFLSENLGEKVKQICGDVDSTAVIPLRKQIGMLSTMDVIYKKLSNLIEPYLPTLLHITVCLLGMCARLLDSRQNLRPQAVNTLKMLRQILLSRLNQFCESFLQYGWSQSEVDGMFEAAIWPQVEKLVFEGIYSPTGLLTLLKTFSSHPRYFCLLGKCRQVGSTDNILTYVFQLLHAKNVNVNVTKVILTLVENLLELEKEDEQEAMEVDGIEVAAIPVAPMVDLIQPERGIGVNLLLNHVPTLLSYLKTVIEALTSATTAPRTPPTQELNILAKLSVFVSDAKESEQLVTLLLPFLASKIQRPQKLEESILEAVKNLLRQVNNPTQFLIMAAPLLSHLTSRTSRTLLTEALRVIGECDTNVTKITDIIIRLNAWDRRQMEEPDYATRLDAFNEAIQLLQTATPDVAQLCLLAHNSSYLISSVEDMSLRDSSSVCLRAIVKAVAVQEDNSDLFLKVIIQQLLPLAKSGMRHKREVARHEFLQLLAEMVASFPTHTCFSQLAKLCDKTDIELDFFHNITHIQIHRRARAMKRLVKQVATLQLGTDCLANYLLPIVTTFIKDETYAKQSNLLDGAVEAIGAICRGLPWQRYSMVLRQYLILLTKSVDQQKLMVRIVVAILDNFHFDLKNSTEMDTRSFAAQSAPDAEDAENKEPPEDAAAGDSEDAEDTQEMKIDEADGSADSDMGKEIVPVPENEVCATGLATRIHKHILRSIIPQLHKVLTQKAKSDDEHKKAFAGKYAEDEEILRVPIALAMVKLLQNLPHKTLQHNLPGVLLKVCNFLKSRANDIRNIARDTLMKILQSLGASYYGFVLHELKATLKRGYQLHILGFTVWHLLHNLTSNLKPGDLDSCLPAIVQVCNNELFGEVAEEKEVDAIASKLHEAKTTKSYDTYALLSKYVTKSSIAKLILPAKEVVMATTSQKTARKVQDVLRYVSKGLVHNTSLDYASLLTFTFGLLTDTLPMLNTAKEKSVPIKPADSRLPPPSKLILEPEPKRTKVKAKANLNANAYVIVEFGLQVLNLMLKQSVIVDSNVDHLQRVDPFIPVLAESLSAKNLKVTSMALRCLLWLLKFPLPSLKENIERINNSLFVLLHNYATAGAAKGDNFELIVMCFKAVTVLVRDVKYHSITENQLHVLLGYAEQDIHDHTRQATAFSLLRAILSRKLVVPQIPEVMSKVQQLSITADSPHVRLQSRQVCLQFLMDYPLGKKLHRHLEFYITQLDYEHEFGRESALEMMATIFATFPQNLLVQNAGFFFIPLASRLVNDDSAKCRKLSALAIKSLLSKLGSNDRDQLFSICIEWFQEGKVPIRRLAAHACGLLVEVEGTSFERHLAILLPIIEHEIQPDRVDKMAEESVVRDADHLLFGVLTLLQKVLSECTIMRNTSWTSQLNSIWGCLESHLMSGHSWVRLAAAQLYGQLFASYTPRELSSHCSQTSEQPAETDEYLHTDTAQKLYELCGSFCKQFSSTLLEQQLADQVVKNLVFVGHVLVHTPDIHLKTKQENNVENESDLVQEGAPVKCASLSWLVRRLCREAKAEAANNPKSSVKRSSVFKWLAAVAAELGPDRLPDYLHLMLPPLLHQTTSNAPTQDEVLKTLATEVVSLIKSTVGVEKFTSIYASAQKNLLQKRQERKQQKAFEAVANPEIAAKRKMKKNLNKAEAKKRKLDEFKPSRKAKKHKS